MEENNIILLPLYSPLDWGVFVGLRLLIAAFMIFITHFIAQMCLFYDLNTIKL